MAIRLLTLLTVLLLTSCGFVSFEDVSDKPEYASYVGANYTTTSNMQVYRISMDQNYGALPSVYKIVAAPGFSGPEILSRTDLPAGTTMQILSVKRCIDCYLDSSPRVHMVVRLASIRQFDDFELQVSNNILSEHMKKIPDHDPRT
jgi:hypothetical protein